MNKRLQKKLRKKILAELLTKAVTELDKELTGKQHKYHAKYPVRQFEINVVTVGPKDGPYKFEVRQSETRDRRPHFHVTKKNGSASASFAIDTCEEIAGEMPSKDIRKIQKWAAENQKLLMEIWNSFHSIKVA